MTTLTGPAGPSNLHLVLRFAATFVLASAFVAAPALAHDLTLPINELEKSVEEVGRVMARLGRIPVVPPPPKTPDDQRRVLGAAEIDLAIGDEQGALDKLLGRISDPMFRELPEYVPSLLLTSQILEKMNEPTGAMMFSRMALNSGGDTESMGEAGARWFRLARRQEVMSKREEMYDLWQSQGGANASNHDVAAEAAYESAFALRDLGRRPEAQRLLATVPSDGAYGSRAAYLAGVLYVESGDLESAVKWFSAVMDWAIPLGLSESPEAKAIEVELRELAAMSAARLLYEKGEKDLADEAYARIGTGSRHLRDACFERAYLAMERKRQLGALRFMGCVTDLGAKGERWVDVRLSKASLLAHLTQYSESVKAYEVLHDALLRERAVLAKTLDNIKKPSDFLFSAMERSAVADGRDATPGPATIFGDSWSADVDRAYRLDRDLAGASMEITALASQVSHYQELLRRAKTFPAFENRRRAYHHLMREMQHLSSHADELATSASESHATADSDPAHLAAHSKATELVAQLDKHMRTAEAQIKALTVEEERRRQQADTALAKIAQETLALAGEVDGLAGPIDGIADEVSAVSLDLLRKRYDNAVMRSEAGVLDTFWVRKEHVSEKIRALSANKEDNQNQLDGALNDMAEDESRE